jgi:cytoplasmic iron level regulating protein YaaA (DUF328/UPF0246 family)
VLILLPPSEGKTAPSRGAPLDLDRLSFPDLTPTRRAVLHDLVAVCTGDPEDAREVLGLSPGLAEGVVRNAVLLDAPSAPAGRIYTGVLYDALGLAGLDAAARRRAARWVAIASAAFGLLRTTDRIPAYRLSAGTTLPTVGALSAAWRHPVGSAIRAAAGRGVVIDLRSGAYASMAPVPGDLADRTVVARVLHERDGRRQVVSHFNKATKGRLVRALLVRGEDARTADDLAGLCGDLGFRVELAPPTRDGRPWTLDVVVTEV